MGNLCLDVRSTVIQHIAAIPAAIRPTAAPSVLCVVSPNAQTSCEGVYEIVEGLVRNGRPVWRKLDGSRGARFLYSSSSGTWNIAGSKAEQQDFSCDFAHIVSREPHGELLPHEILTWEWTDGRGFYADSDISIQVISFLPVRSPKPAAGPPRRAASTQNFEEDWEAAAVQFHFAPCAAGFAGADWLSACGHRPSSPREHAVDPTAAGGHPTGVHSREFAPSLRPGKGADGPGSGTASTRSGSRAQSGMTSRTRSGRATPLASTPPLGP